jgi:hypothetical protein
MEPLAARLSLSMLAVLLMSLGAVGCSRGDKTDVVRAGGVEYVLDCTPVRTDARGAQVSGRFSSASREVTADVATYDLGTLPRDRVIAVAGPPEHICPRGAVPGSAVAFSPKTDLASTLRDIGPFVVESP